MQQSGKSGKGACAGRQKRKKKGGRHVKKEGRGNKKCHEEKGGEGKGGARIFGEARDPRVNNRRARRKKGKKG